MQMFRRVAIVALYLVLCASHAAYAQNLFGSLVGNITDSSGAAIAAATVRIVQTETAEARAASTNKAGVFSFPSIPPGNYSVEVSMAGFQSAKREQVAIRNSDTVRVDIALQVGTRAESVQVSADAETLQTDGADVRAEIGAKTLQDTPLPPGRNFQNLLVTVPGITPPVNANSVSANPARSLAYMANGSKRSGNVMTIDGASVESTWLQQVSAYVPGLESIEVVNVASNSYDAAQGFAGGAAVNVQVRSGSNQIHGSGFEYNFNNAMIARPFFLPAGQRNPKSILNNFGGTVGGPVIKNRLFFFGSYDGSLTRQNASGYYTVPTAAVRSGNESADPLAIYDPSTGTASGTGRTAFPGNIIPASRISPIALQIANLTPLPNLPGNLLTNNYFADGPYLQNRGTTDGKVTYRATDKLNIGVRFGWLHFLMNDPPAFGALGGPQLGSTGGAEGRGLGNVFSNTVTANYVVTPRFVIDGYFGYTLLDTNQEPPGLSQNIGQNLGIPGTNGTTPAEGGWPAFSISGYTALGNQTTVPFYFHNGNYQYVASGNWTNGTHTIRFGVDTLRKQLKMFQELNQASGSFSFANGVTGLSGGPAQNQYNSYAAFLLGLPSTIAKGEERGDNQNYEWFYSLYVQDKWQVSRQLTLSYGLRWEYFAPPVGDMQRYNAATNMMVICGSPSNPSSDCGTKFSRKLFSPRLGLAYRPSEGLVVRAGFGISYDPFFIGQQILRIYPNQISYSLTGPNTYQPVTTLAQGIPPLVFPDAGGNGSLPMPTAVSLNSLGDTYTRSYTMSWNLTLQKQLKYGLVLQAGYVGNRSVHQQYEINVNAGQILGAGTAGEPLNALFGRTATTNYFEPFGRGSYDALQTSLNKRFAHGFLIQASYSWAKAISFCCSDSEDAGPQIPIPAYQSLNRAVEPFDRTQIFAASAVAELPFGKGKMWLSQGRFLQALVSGWQVNTLVSAYTGLPFTVTGSSTSLNTPGSAQTADQIKPEVARLGGVGPGQSWFDPLAYANVTQVRFGTSGFDSLRGPGSFNMDASLFRTFSITERVKIQFRGQVFNVTNTPHFANPASNVNNLVLNPNGTINNLGGFTSISSTTGAGREGIDQRVFQLAARLSF